MSNKAYKKELATDLDYEKIVNTPEFKSFVKRKNKFMTPYIIFFFAAYFLLPILTGFTSILEVRAIGWITWTWMYSFGMFIMVWVFATIYMKKASGFDEESEEIIAKNILK
ncbi:DUF485 domain-containing protein [Bacillus sp. FJAT-29790]|uniref:DUF485 domain-containing protein n=1 Tax=Bacillus sp. FJAT-29790 TaxID=1895002 RepID=UPI001C2479CD|nr:DUF485 domain-containing protein [Bacillus sp. FJAT-29790]MBU8878456.1 DUF485 domain-containing protein [Bacillus sp. FJAT-29790]